MTILEAAKGPVASVRDTVYYANMCSVREGIGQIGQSELRSVGKWT
jgi:hypothetical protein